MRLLNKYIFVQLHSNNRKVISNCNSLFQFINVFIYCSSSTSSMVLTLLQLGEIQTAVPCLAVFRALDYMGPALNNEIQFITRRMKMNRS